MAHSFLSSNPGDIQFTLDETNRRLHEQEATRKAQNLGLPYLNLQGFPINLNALSLFTAAEARAAEGFPIYKEGRDIRVITINPRNQLLQTKIADLKTKFSVSVYFVSKQSLESTLKLYAKVMVTKAQADDTIRLNSSLNYEEKLHALQAPETQAQTTVTDIAGCLFGAALSMSASDIHLEPEETFVKVRFRIDGVLQDIFHLDKHVHTGLITRIKLFSHLKLNVENLPQDGRLTFYRDQSPIDVRVSTLPSAYGEGLVLRLLTGSNSMDGLDMQKLGLRGRALTVITEALAKPNGMIITTGPTGSGKTTTLYAFLSDLNEPGVKIITIEDPVEYKLSGIQQTPIDHRVDFSFAKALRAILRQDPDIIMVGEIRDAETAETALQAALTGHVVLSTLHTNDAIGTVPRLITMGVKPFIIAPALNAIIAQRLVRKLCENCKKPVDLNSELLAKVQGILADVPKNGGIIFPEKLTFYHSAGCEQCHNLGYRGRIGIYEVIEVTDNFREYILKDAPATDMKRYAVTQGMVSMVQDGLLKALEGITDVEEVFRVAGD
jgi:type II secretory ATPase GspE/PulE/Tfp pilus assembly ATPase PilB-like protein